MVYTFIDGQKLQTQKVPKNESYGGYSVGNSKSLLSYAGESNGQFHLSEDEKDWVAWEKEEKDRENNFKLGLSKLDTIEENFNTWKDERKGSETALEQCDTCFEYATLNQGLCSKCFEIDSKDIPPMSCLGELY